MMNGFDSLLELCIANLTTGFFKTLDLDGGIPFYLS